MIDTLLSHLTTEELQAGLDHVRLSPSDGGVLDLIVRRPTVNERELLEDAELSLIEGLVGDTWNRRRSKSTPDGSPNIEMDLSTANLPAGTRLALGEAVIEVTAPPHLGCQKFVARFGLEAMKFVNSPVGKELRLRGLHARVVQAGRIRQGDRAYKV